MKSKKPPLLENDDYYINEEGFMVFTKKYLLKREVCCKSGCRHCPYGYLLKKEEQ